MKDNYDLFENKLDSPCLKICHDTNNQFSCERRRSLSILRRNPFSDNLIFHQHNLNKAKNIKIKSSDFKASILLEYR